MRHAPVTSGKRLAAWLGACALALLGAAGALFAPPPGACGEGEPAARAEGYAGAETCRSCHAAAYEAWSRSSHANTVLEASPHSLPPEALAGGTVHHPPGTTVFHRAQVDGEDAWFAETLGPDGEPRRYPLTHVVGRIRIRMYLTRLPDERIQVLPAMREEPTGRWFDYSHLIFGQPGGLADPMVPPEVAPGDPSFWTGPVRSWDARCSRCHVSGREVEPPRPGSSGAKTSWRRLGVDCESCHGPAAAHVDARAAGRPDDTVLLMRTLAQEQALSLCLRCHTEGEVIDPRLAPGIRVLDHVDPTLLDDPWRVDPYGRPLELIYDGLPFLSSTCAQEGRLTCFSCHDPHGSEHRSQLIVPHHDDALCTACHGEQGEQGRAHHHHDPAGAGARCVSCHMPFLSIERGHGAVADHTIGIPRLDLPGDRVATDACTWCHEGGLNAPPEVPAVTGARLREAYGAWWPHAKPPPLWQQRIATGRLGGEDALGALVALLEDEGAPPVGRATAARLLARHGAAAAGTLRRFASDPDSLVRREVTEALGAVGGAGADLVLRLALADPHPAVRLRAARAVLGEDYERARRNRALLDAALPLLEADALAVPDDDARWFRLGAAREIAGDMPGARDAYERVLALDPFAEHVRAYVARLREREGE